MFKGISKIILISLMVPISWSGLSALCGTLAMFNDTESVAENVLQAGTLAITVNADAFSPAINSAGGESFSTVNIGNIGTLPLYYKISTATSTLDGELCSMLDLSLDLSGALNGGDYSKSQSLANFTTGAYEVSVSDSWVLRATLADGFNDANGKTCKFALAIDARQDNLEFGQGFHHRAEIATLVSASNSVSGGGNPPMPRCTHNPNIVINEFLPNPIGDDDAPMPGGEWVELYNADNHPVDLNGWFLYTSEDGDGLKIHSGNTNNGSTIIYPGGFLVVFRDGDPAFEIRNSGEEAVRLFDQPIGEGVEEIDGVFFTYGDDGALEGKSFARIPDGTGQWIDPTPTPGEANQLGDGELPVPLMTITLRELANSLGITGDQEESALPGTSGQDQSNDKITESIEPAAEPDPVADPEKAAANDNEENNKASSDDADDSPPDETPEPSGAVAGLVDEGAELVN